MSPLIVVLEDNAAVQELLERALRGHGYDVLVTSSDEELSALAARLQIDVLVATRNRDPGATDHLRTLQPQMHFITTDGGSCEDAPVLSQPFSLDQLGEAIAAVLQKNAAHDDRSTCL